MDWYRRTTWTADDADLFESKLKRARSWSRPQYLRIQGLTLVEQDGEHLREHGRALLRRVLHEYDGEGEDKIAAEVLAGSLCADGFLDESVETYLDTLRRIEVSPSGRSSTSGVTELWLARTLLLRGRDGDVQTASSLLDAVEPEIEEHAIIRRYVFQYLATRAQVAARSDTHDAAVWAQAALHLIEKEPELTSQLAPDNAPANAGLLEELARIVSSTQ